eukprot:180488_1
MNDNKSDNKTENQEDEKHDLLNNDEIQVEMNAIMKNRNDGHGPHTQQEEQKEHTKEITSEVINNGWQMLIMWLFIIFQTAFIIIKYGPLVKPSQCSILSLEFNMKCSGWIYYVYPIQCGSYLFCGALFLCCTCGEGKLCNIISQHLFKCDKLAFPFAILCIMVTVEFLGIFFNWFDSKQSKFWYLFQIGIDLIGYILWMSYASVAGTICRRSQKIQIGHKMLLWHIVFMCVAIFDIMWLIAAMFGQDFGFDPNTLYVTAFIQIILESTLVLELIHVIMENCIGEHHSDTDTVELQVSDSQNVHTLRQRLVARKCWIFIFIFPIIAQLGVSAFKFMSSWTNCSNFDLWINASDNGANECPRWWLWAVQLGLYVIAFLSLMIMFCGMDQLEFKLLEFKRLYFPLCIGLIMIFVQIVYVYAINPYYLLQVGLDFFAYLIIFMQSLYVVQFKKYKSECTIGWVGLLNAKQVTVDDKHYELYPVHDLRIGSCPNWRLMFVMLEMALFFGVIGQCIVANIITDIHVQQVAKSLHENHQKNEQIVEVIAFIQIVFENTLCLEYLHIVLGSIA